MITFNYETHFNLESETTLSSWIESIINKKELNIGELNYIFCDDNYLHKLNVQYLNHDTLTDVISFDNSIGKQINGDIYISIERVKENANDFKVTFREELHRVMIHGVLHFMGFKDKTKEEIKEMRNQEDFALSVLKH